VACRRCKACGCDGRQCEAWSKAAAKAARQNDAHAKQAPLFAGQGDTSAAEQFWHTRLRVSQCQNRLSDLQGKQALAWLAVGQYERVAAAVLPWDQLQRLYAKREALLERRAGHEYHIDLWASALRAVGVDLGSAYDIPPVAAVECPLPLYEAWRAVVDEVR
jgi:hypothetical protein